MSKDRSFPEGMDAIERVVPPVEVQEESADLLRSLQDENERLKEQLMERNKDFQLAKAKLFHADKLAFLGTMGASVAHELNNPLTAISAEADEILDALDGGYYSTEQTGVSVRNIKNCAERMRDIVDYIRQHTRNDEAAPWAKLDLNEVIYESLFILRPQLDFLNIKLVTKLAADLPQIWGHKSKLESIFQNLVSNAKDAFENTSYAQSRNIFVASAKSEDESIIVSIEDNACGIDEGIQNRIFEPFFTTKAPGHGTGLGLALVADLVTEHKGNIKLESEVGVGSKFILRFPLERRVLRQS